MYVVCGCLIIEDLLEYLGLIYKDWIMAWLMTVSLTQQTLNQQNL